jgi:CheY-like chemotaxis protein
VNGQRTMKLLIVDDEEINIKLLASILEDKKITPLFATNGSDALAMARKELPDLILLDVIMPDIDGYEVCKRLQADPATKDIPIIFLTGQRSAVDEAKGLDMGAVDYIFKPYDPHIVRSKIQNQLALRGGGSGKNSAGGGGAGARGLSQRAVAAAAVVVIAVVAGVIFFGSDSEFFQGLFGEDVPEATGPQPRLADNADQRLAVGLGAATLCGEIPPVEWWDYKTHVTVAIRVRSRFEGDWDAYIDVWTARYDNLVKLFEDGAAARVVDTDVVLAGADLQNYVSQMATRLDVTKCLANEAQAAAVRAN